MHPAGWDPTAVPDREAFGALFPVAWVGSIAWAGPVACQCRVVRESRLGLRARPEFPGGPLPHLQSRLIRRGEEPAAIRARVVNKLPLIVVIFLVKYANTLGFARAGDSNDRPPTEHLSAGRCASRSRRAGSTRSTGSSGWLIGARVRPTGRGVAGL